MTTLVQNQLWQTVDAVYHASDDLTITVVPKLDEVGFYGPKHSIATWNCSMFSCRLWHDPNGQVHNPNQSEGRPNLSPWADNHVVLHATEVLSSPDDFLLPLCNDIYRGRRHRGGNDYIELLYVRDQDIAAIPGYTKDVKVERWRIRVHPYVQLDDQGTLRYRVEKDVWPLILTPYTVPIPEGATWDKDLGIPGGVSRETKWNRMVDHPITWQLIKRIQIN